ncbi:MAG: methionine synthase [Bacteroidaceae bacterium]|nr:methionine synthase [Bacteroidaceae bacterium]
MNDIYEALRRRILILDGAMGTKIQSLRPTADDFHRGRFAAWPVSLVGNNDVLSLTAPDMIAGIHRTYVQAGADIISTNTFSSNRISQKEYGCEAHAREMALAGAQIAKRVADEALHESGRRVWVAGSMGPTSKSLTLASDMSRPAMRSVGFDEMAAAYEEQAEALLEGGADVLLLETCYDALNTKAALYAIQRLNERLRRETPVMVSATVNDRSGRTLTGQTLEAFYVSIAHYPHLLSFGLNCSFGVADLRPLAEAISARVPVFVSIHPNAGLPNEMGEYEEVPHYTASHLRQMAEAGLLNIAGGCCGTDECHIQAISEALRGIEPRRPVEADTRLWLAGLEALAVPSTEGGGGGFIPIGERTNVAGSRKFARLIAEKKYDEALTVARHQIEGGAHIIDINMDDAMLDSREEMQAFCRYVSGDPSVARAVLMIDSSDWPTVVAGLKNAQGKCIVNSISLKAGEEDFIRKARELRRLGAAVVVMAFDEEGQATTFARKTSIAQRAYRLLTGIGFPPQDIIFDTNILSVATGIKAHEAYAIDFIRAVEWIKHHLPLAKTSGGVSNLSFSFRGNNKVREAMHSVFLYHAIGKGLDMAIVNPTMLQVYDDIEPRLLRTVEDVILNTDDEATERLIALAAEVQQATGTASAAPQSPDTLPDWRGRSVEERLSYALTKGIGEHLAEDVPEALAKYGKPIEVIEKPLMEAMKHIGQLFGEGRMFLPQVVKSAQVMKEAVALLQPYIDAASEADGGRERPCVVLATANGDVHDIGKNIVGIVLACNGFDVQDLGVMVANEAILEAVRRYRPVFVGVSGLITPSLKEMEQLCQLFQREGLRTPILVGGATTSAVHTAVRLAPLYDALVVYGGDASQTSVLAKRMELDLPAVAAEAQEEQHLLRTAYEAHHSELVAYAEANSRAPRYQWFSAEPAAAPQPPTLCARLSALVDWRMFLLFWGFKGESLPQLLVNPEAERTLHEGQQYLQKAISEGSLRVRSLVRFEPAVRRGNDIVLQPDGTLLPMLRSQSPSGHFCCLADYFDPERPSKLGMFVVTADALSAPADDTERLMQHALCARLAEAAAEWLQRECYGEAHVLRAAFGYPTCPDHSLKRIVFDRIEAERQLGITLTDHYSIQPSTSVCGLLIAHPEARYFPVGRIDRSQLTDYCQRRGISPEDGEQLLSKYIKEDLP